MRVPYDGLYNSRNFFVRYIFKKRLKNIVSLMPKSGKMLKVLDAGCGGGQVISALKQKYRNYKYHGIDILKERAILCKLSFPSAEFKTNSVLSIDYDSEYFDVVICSDVLEHIADLNKAISELKRVLKKNGCLIVSFPNDVLWTAGRLVLFRWPPKLPQHVNALTPNTISERMNLKLVSVKALPFWLGWALKFKKA